MKKGIIISWFLLIGFIAILWIAKPLRAYLSTSLFDVLTAKLISDIFVRAILVIVVVILIQKFKLVAFSGLTTWRKIKNIQAALIAIVFIIIGITSNWHKYFNSPNHLLLLFAIKTLSVGIVEELLFRGTIFPLFIQSFEKSKRTLLISAILSSLLFGLIHYVNLFSQPENFIGITSQVFFATSIGVFFCGLMVRTGSILIPIVIHALINFSFGAGELSQAIEKASEFNNISSLTDLNTLIPTTIFFTFIFIGGIYMIKKTDEEEIIKKLEIT
ncbi:MAG TPA: CPBP family intramembrane metalloprotease [Saprospiraceae bacterium]|nr:CPBP family intramembrane metalloprotease [Saprospiraceae bacterium]